MENKEEENQEGNQENQGTLKKIDKLKGINISMQLQSNIVNQLKGLDIGKVSAINRPTLGIERMLIEMQSSIGNQFKGVDMSKFSAFNTSTPGIVSAITQLQSSIGNQFKGIDMSKFSAFNASTLGIVGMLEQFQSKIGNQFKDLDFDNVKINEDGTIDYLNETINIEDAVEEVNSYILEDISNQQEVEQNTDYFEKIKSRMNIIIYVFLFVLFISMYPKSYNIQYEDNSIEYQISENLENLYQNIEHGLEEMVKLFLFIFTFLIKFGGSLDDFATKHPGKYPLIIFVLPYIIALIVYIAKKQKESIKYSDEILNDKKRTIKLIKRQIKNSIKEKFKSEMINQIFHNNVGLVIKKSLNVKTSNNINSPIIYKLPLGEIVEIIDENKDWTKIKFDGKDNCCYIGWVFTIYINRFE